MELGGALRRATRRLFWLLDLPLHRIEANLLGLSKFGIRHQSRFHQKLAGHRRQKPRRLVARENVLPILTPRDTQQLSRAGEADVAKPTFFFQPALARSFIAFSCGRMPCSAPMM